MPLLEEGAEAEAEEIVASDDFVSEESLLSETGPTDVFSDEAMEVDEVLVFPLSWQDQRKEHAITRVMFESSFVRYISLFIRPTRWLKRQSQPPKKKGEAVTYKLLRSLFLI